MLMALLAFGLLLFASLALGYAVASARRDLVPSFVVAAVIFLLSMFGFLWVVLDPATTPEIDKVVRNWCPGFLGLYMSPPGHADYMALMVLVMFVGAIIGNMVGLRVKSDMALPLNQ